MEMILVWLEEVELQIGGDTWTEVPDTDDLEGMDLETWRGSLRSYSATIIFISPTTQSTRALTCLRTSMKSSGRISNIGLFKYLSGTHTFGTWTTDIVVPDAELVPSEGGWLCTMLANHSQDDFLMQTAWL